MENFEIIVNNVHKKGNYKNLHEALILNGFFKSHLLKDIIYKVNGGKKEKFVKKIEIIANSKGTGIWYENKIGCELEVFPSQHEKNIYNCLESYGKIHIKDFKFL